MPQLEQIIDKKLGITDSSNIGQWSQVESAIDAKLGIEPDPEPTFEEKEKHIRDILVLSDEMEIPYRRVIEEYDEIERQKKEFPFGQLQSGEYEFSARKLFSGLWDRVKPPPLGEASPGQIFQGLKEGFKGAGHIGIEYGVGRYTLRTADVLAAPVEAFFNVYLANKKLRKNLIAQGNTVTDVGTKYSPVWRITDADENVEFIVPNTVADKELVKSVAELYDRIVGLEVSSAQKTWGEIAKTIGTVKSAAKLKTKITGPLPKGLGPFGNAVEAAKIGIIYGTVTELSKGLTGNESYRGSIAVAEDAVVFAALSLIGSGVKGIWSKLKPTEHRKALKLLGLKESELAGLSEAEQTKIIKRAAARNFFKYHPDKVKGMEVEFNKVVKARDLLQNPDYGKDIIRRGRPPSTVKLLTGVTEEGIPIVPAKPPIKVEPTPILKPPAAAPVAKVPVEGIKVPPKPTKAVTEGEVVARIPGTDIEFDEVKAAFDGKNTLVVFTKEGESVHRFIVRDRGVALEQVKNFKTLLAQPPPEAVAEAKEVQVKPSEVQVKPSEVQVPTKPIAGKEVTAGKAQEGKKLPPHLQAIADKAKEIERKKGFTITDVTPEEFGPSEAGEPVPGTQLTTEQNKLISTINEAKTILKGDVSGEKRAAIERSLAKAEKKLEAQPPAEAVTEEMPLTDEELNKTIDDFRPGFVDIEPYVESLKTAHDWVFTFGETKRLNPELFDKLMESYGKRNAAVEKAISILKRTTVANLTTEEAMEIALVYEDKRLSPPEGLEETYKGYAGILDKVEKRSIKEGIFKETFQERMIAENEAKIGSLKEKLLHPNKSKQIAELVAENEQLRQIRYLPHSIVARRTIEAKLADLKGEKRKTYLDSLARISSKFKKRTGKLFMKDYLEAGILKPEDIDIRRLTANALTDYYYRSALKDLFDYAVESELVKPTSNALRKEGWQNQQEIGIISPELKGKVVHPLFASSLAEMKEMKLGKGSGTLRQLLSMIKIGQFIKPSIIWTYNAIQAFMKGMYFINPIKSHALLTESFKSVIAKDALYHKLNESNLYQFPYEVSRGSVEEQIEQYIRQNSPEINRLTKLLEKTTDMTWKAEDLDLKKMIMVGHRALANLTWLGDKVQRTHSYKILIKMGYPHEEAVKVAANSHGAYSALSEKFKKTLSPILFVYSFRILMPIEIAKILTEPLIGISRVFVKGESIPTYKWNRWVKSWVGAVAIPLLTDMYMKKRGFEKEGKHLGPLAWKWKKTVIVNGKKQEIVVGVNNILNIPVKYWNRITYYNPIRPEARWQQAMNNLIKWEIHPLWRIFFWDIKENRKSFGSGVNVYDPNDSSIEQIGQAFLYIFGQSFRFWGGMMDAVGEGDMTDKERNAQKEVFNEGLNKLDKFLFSVFGYKYVRAPIEERKAIALSSLQKEMTKRVFQIAKKYEGQELKERQEDLKKWAERCKQWIDKGMK